MMATHCEFLNGCPMFSYFCQCAESSLYRLAYCEGDFYECERRVRRLEGQAVPVNLTPEGTKLWPDEAAPPKEFSA